MVEEQTRREAVQASRLFIELVSRKGSSGMYEIGDMRLVNSQMLEQARAILLVSMPRGWKRQSEL